MKSNATNDVGVAVENLLAAALHRLIEKKASPEKKPRSIWLYGLNSRVQISRLL